MEQYNNIPNKKEDHQSERILDFMHKMSNIRLSANLKELDTINNLRKNLKNNSKNP